MNEIARDHFPEEQRVVIEWTGGDRDTPIRFTVGPVTGELPANTPTIVPANVATVIAEGHNIVVSAVPDDYEAPEHASDDDANHPGGAGDAGTMKVLDGVGGAPATVTPTVEGLVGGSINGGGEGQQGDPTDYPARTSAAFGAPGDDALKDAADAGAEEGDSEGEGEDEDTSEEEDESDSSDDVLDKAKQLQGQTIGKIEEQIAAGVDLPVLQAALDAETGAGPDKERSGAVAALTKAIEQHPDNKAS